MSTLAQEMQPARHSKTGCCSSARSYLTYLVNSGRHIYFACPKTDDQKRLITRAVRLLWELLPERSRVTLPNEPGNTGHNLYRRGSRGPRPPSDTNGVLIIVLPEDGVVGRGVALEFLKWRRDESKPPILIFQSGKLHRASCYWYEPISRQATACGRIVPRPKKERRQLSKGRSQMLETQVGKVPAYVPPQKERQPGG